MQATFLSLIGIYAICRQFFLLRRRSTRNAGVDFQLWQQKYTYDYILYVYLDTEPQRSNDKTVSVCVQDVVESARIDAQWTLLLREFIFAMPTGLAGDLSIINK